MFNGRRTPICFTTTIMFVSLLLILMMTMMIKDCEAAACSGTVAECMVIEGEEQEFLMDTEEHRRILATTNSNSISYGSLQSGSPACGDNCAGERYNVNDRQCKMYERCRS
uniref:Rapid alkalization factor-like peptide 8 n=1 Tax=Taraxacum kok-saghyz TaxID=333970 RepID=A0A513QBX4_TARKO|nr:rapid alkalization factor-like peptide 8 [Taraxacum kok-saghyz]